MEADETWKFLSAYALVLCAESVTLLTIYFRLGFLQARKLPNGLFFGDHSKILGSCLSTPPLA